MVICEVFRVMPWDMGRLLVADYVGMVETVEARNAEAKKQEREARSRR